MPDAPLPVLCYNQFMRLPKARGFTLLELIIITAIIVLLSLVAIVTLASSQRKSRDAKRLADLKELQQAVQYYHSEYTTFPITTNTTNETWAALGGSIQNYITNLPIDPKNDDGRGYVYSYGTNDVGDEYVLGAQLEDTNHTALNGDDDNTYTFTNAGWANLDLVESDDVANEVVATFACDDASGRYCISD